MEDLFVPRAGMSSTHMSNGCIIAALTCISWYNIFCMLYGPILKFLFDVSDSSSSKQSCWLHRTLWTPHESEVYGLTHVSPLWPRAPGWPSRRFCAVGSRAVVSPLLFSQGTCFSPSSSLKHTRQHFWNALNTSRLPGSGTNTCLISHVLLPETPAWIYTLGNCWICGDLISLPFGALSLWFFQCMRTEVLQ